MKLILIAAAGAMMACSTPTLTREILDDSLARGTEYLLNNQKPAGNFTYTYDFDLEKEVKGMSPVRQAGALWGLAILHHDAPTAQTAAALKRGIAFYERHSRLTPDRTKRFVVYPKTSKGRTGTQALFVLALVDMLRTTGYDEWPNAAERAGYEKLFAESLEHLLSLRMPNGQFWQSFSHANGVGGGLPSPYFDGESLLALSRAGRFTGRTDLEPLILDSARAMYEKNVTAPRKTDPDSNTTKGFYQWGSMAFLEIHKAGWADSDVWAERTIELAYWMIDTHRTLSRRRNTAYAHEGMISAWELARETGNTAAQKKIERVVNRGLYKLTSWQVGGPVQNKFLQKIDATDQKLAVGGVMNAKDEPILRIDVTQHQMHAVVLARRYIYRSRSSESNE